MAQDAAGDSGWPAARAVADVRVAKKLMYPQHTDADSPAHLLLARPAYTTAIAGSQVLVAPSTSTVIGSLVDGSADSITAAGHRGDAQGIDRAHGKHGCVGCYLYPVPGGQRGERIAAVI